MLTRLRRAAADVLRAVARRLSPPAFPIPAWVDQVPLPPGLRFPAPPANAPGAYLAVAKTAQALAKHLGDRQNRDTLLHERECTAVVSALLSSGNLLERALQNAETETP